MKTLFFGGSIITMAEPLYAEAVLVEDGRITAVGDERELRTYGADEYVDLGGAVMLPGFIDTHSHLTEYAEAALQADLDEISDFETLRDTVRAYIKDYNIPKGEWVVARNYDNELFFGARKLTIEELDSICPDHLLLIKHVGCHMGLVNSNVFEKFGITAETPDPKCGCYVRENGRLTGCLEETACTNIRMSVPAPTVERVCEAHRRMQTLYASYGITTAQDGYLGERMIDVYRRLLDEDALKLDLFSYVHIPHYERLKAAFDAVIGEGERVRIGGIKQYLDGSVAARTGWMREPYLESGDHCGYPQRTDEQVIDTMRYASRHGLQIIYHSIGDAANEQFVRALEAVEKECPNLKDLRPVLIHAVFMDRPMLKRAAELGAVISFLEGETYYFGDAYIRILGLDRAKMVCPAKTALECGVSFNLHTDAPVTKPNILEMVQSAATRMTRDGVCLDGEEISVLDGLRAVTSSAAYQYFQENEKGTIEAGKLADLVVLDKDPLTTDVKELAGINVLQTYKEGVSIYKR